MTPNSRDKQLQLTWAYSNRQKINTNVKNSLKEGIILYSQRSLINSPENFLALDCLERDRERERERKRKKIMSDGTKPCMGLRTYMH